MSAKLEGLRGYHWVMTARGFEIYTRAYNGHTFAVMCAGVAEQYGIEATQFECFDGDPYLTVIDEFWESNGL